ncbi:Retrovirus-related Pol polyprotein from transposon opus [Acropora cervicornis]|uniref:Retrovirus-related Pol polyprotein from transposon opus n=1 Tax=Acropora cervicornis TaxID=6130 RepID=A0AAD9URM0_ACRCE|nr:Retrovirus-related Pol polyprotein from transposon opus [Acropora cervicornis]
MLDTTKSEQLSYCLEGNNSIRVDNNIPPVVDPPRKVPVPLRETFKTELDNLVKNGILAKVTEPTSWVSSFVIVKKPNGKIRSKKKKPYYKQREAETPTVSSFLYKAPPILTAEGLRPDPSKVEAIVHYPPPTNLAELRTFLGMAQYLAKFCQHMSTVSQPLRQLEKKS